MQFTLSIRSSLTVLAACLTVANVNLLPAQNPLPNQFPVHPIQAPVQAGAQVGGPGIIVQQPRMQQPRMQQPRMQLPDTPQANTTQKPNTTQQPASQLPAGRPTPSQAGATAPKNPTTKSDSANEKLVAPQPHIESTEFSPMMGSVDRSGFSIHNPPPQPQVAAGRCQPCTVGIDCADNCGGARQSWKDLHQYPFQPLAHGEFMGPIRLPSTMDYRLRVGDQLSFVFIDSPSQLAGTYRLMVGDEVAIESATDDKIRKGDLQQGRGLVIQPDGKLTVALLGEVEAAGLTIPQLRHNLEIKYKAFIREPSIDVTPIKTNSLKSAILNSVDARAGTGGQNWVDTVHADGTVRLPKLGAICVLGMTVDEVKREINLRFGRIVSGLEVEPKIASEAQHFIFVTGEVASPNRYQLLGPTSVTQAITLAGGHRVGGNLRQIVIFRRGEDWRLIATKVDLRGAILGRDPTPADEIWLRDSDTVIVPQTPVKLMNNFVRQVFTEGIYGALPFSYSISTFRGGSFSSN